MSYQHVIQKYHELYTKATREEILDHWAVNDRGLNVYVHSPFCSSVCAFCYHKGVHFDSNQHADLYSQFYNSYLPKAVRPFLPVLQQNEIGNYYFGGGTASLMTPDSMAATFDLFPGFKSTRSKTFEIHPAEYSDRQLDILAEYGFNCCIIGVQSFDEQVLLRQNRLHASAEEVAALVAKVKDRGMYVAADIIYHMDAVDADEIFRDDLRHLTEMNFDVISLQQNYDLRDDAGVGERFLSLVEASGLMNRYYWPGGKNGEKLPPLNRSAALKCLRCVLNGIARNVYREEIFPFMTTIDEVSTWRPSLVSDRKFNSTIGFGSYKNPRKNTFSNIVTTEKVIEYIEVNNNWEPEYFITYRNDVRRNLQIFSQALAKIKTLGVPPEGVSVGTKPGHLVSEDTIFRKRENRELFHVIGWAERNGEIDNYVERLRTQFPDMVVRSGESGEFVLL